MQAPSSLPHSRRILFTLGILLAFLVLTDSLARTLGSNILEQARAPTPEREDDAPNLNGNPYLLWEMAPGIRHEMGVLAHINSLGLRGPEWSPSKPRGVRRIMALGDSSVFGFGVEDQQVFTAVLDDMLGDGVQAINAAVPGYSTFQTINLLKMRALALHPDLLLVACQWSDNNFDSFVDKELLAAYGTFGNRWARRARSILEYSALFRLLDYQLRVAGKIPGARKVGWMVGRGEHIGPRRVELNDYAQNLETITELAHEHDAEVMFMILANEEDIEPSSDGPAAWDPYRRAIRDTAARHCSPVLDVPALFQASGLGKDELLLDEMHPSAQGHRIIAEALASILEERGWPEGAPIESDPKPGPVPTYTDLFIQENAPEPPPPQPEGMLEAADAPSISGSVLVPQYKAGAIQIDIVDASADPPRVVGSTRLEEPGPFHARLTARADSIRFIAYLDENGDGPGPGDTRVVIDGDALEIPQDGDLENLVGDLSRGTATTTFSADTPPPQQGPAPTPSVPASHGP